MTPRWALQPAPPSSFSPIKPRRLAPSATRPHGGAGQHMEPLQHRHWDFSTATPPGAAMGDTETAPLSDMGAVKARAAGVDQRHGWAEVYFDQGEHGYDEADEGLPLPKLNDDPHDLAPFIPADKAVVQCALRITGCSRSDRLIDIGSGDGRFCVAAAQQAGVDAALGLELNPWLVVKSRAAAAACGVGPPQVKFLEADATALDFAALDASEGPFSIAISFLTSDVEGVGGVTEFLRKVVNRGGQVVSVHFALNVAGLRLVAEDLQHRVLVYGAD